MVAAKRTKNTRNVRYLNASSYRMLLDAAVYHYKTKDNRQQKFWS